MAACGESSGPGGEGTDPNTPPPEVTSVYDVPGDLSALSGPRFFDHPWPSDFRLRKNGTVRFEGYPNPGESSLIGTYIESMRDVLTGFSPVATGYLRFSAPIDPSSLPATPPDALSSESSVQLIDIDPASPERGERKLISLRWERDAVLFVPENTLSFMPAVGFPLRPATRYALVVTDALLGAEGGRVGANDSLRAALGLVDGEGSAHSDALATSLPELAAAGVAAESIAHLAVFTTNSPAEETARIRDWLHDSYDAPTVREALWAATDHQDGAFDVYESEYGPTPNFQGGTAPYKIPADGGALTFDADGTPLVQNEDDLRFSLMVPDEAACPQPPDGYPIVLNAHGTGGNYKTFVTRGEGGALAPQCLAVMGVDQIFHETRPGYHSGSLELTVFNLNNPTAARATMPQSAIDVVQQARLFTDSDLRIPASVSRTGKEIRFDASKMSFIGHSQGGLNGPLFLAVDDSVRGAVLSGSGSMIAITLLDRKDFDVVGLVRALAFGPADDGSPLTVFHPVMSLAQTIVDPADPIHYVPMIARRPRPGFSPKSILMTEGVSADGSGDSQTPPHGTEAQAIALGLPPQEPVIHAIAELPWSDLLPVKISAEGLSGNIANGEASGALAQWEATQASDGHYVLYEVPGAMTQAAQFLRNLADDPKGRVPPR